ncbi:hypothetical protein [Scleromatobacter humisilvae]|uniref:Uncharacterized protein n=1 Tax=Scleromatobacter humisilvae TaxID=2897159 RepID=A0A9X2C1H6_9BURK|nr:hypothetical protein [Scleromatobacter humisilvae]MCK9684995.1 hypothetical protein [Scleromatobacter humisilvae]
MPKRLVPVALALILAGAVVTAFADGAPPVAVQERTLKLPKLPAGADMPGNLPRDGAIKMPFVTGGAPGVAKRINAAVWNEMLDGVPVPSAPGRTFTPPPGKETQGTSSLEFKAEFIPAFSPRLLSLALDGEGCGAYCENFAYTRLFDLRDGRLLSLGDLLTPDGFAEVGRRVDAGRRSAYRRQLRELEGAIKAAARRTKKDPNDDSADRVAMNKDCLESVDSQPSTPWWLLNEGFSLDGHGGMKVFRYRCSNHAGRALDDVGDITIPIPAAELAGLLTPYGLAVVRQQGDAPAPPARFDGRELHGRVGGAAITMKLEPLREGVDTQGWYAYDRYRAPIKLVVQLQGGQVVAVEQTASQGRFELTIGGGSLAGTWSDKDRHKELPAIVQ